jgi:hypothetical protein
MKGNDALSRFGLRHGEAIRFRRSEHGRWAMGRVAGSGSDGSVLVHDADGAARSLLPTAVEVRRPGRSGRLEWRCVAEIANSWCQLELFS